MVCEKWCALKVVNRNVEEALNLICVKIHCKHTVSTCTGDDVCTKLSRDRISCLSFSVLSCITEVWHNNCDSCSGCTLHGINHYEHFHKIVVDGSTGWLNNKAVAATNRFVKRNRDFAVWELCTVTLTKRQTKTACNSLSYINIWTAGENFNVLTVKIHCNNSFEF